MLHDCTNNPQVAGMWLYVPFGSGSSHFGGFDISSNGVMFKREMRGTLSASDGPGPERRNFSASQFSCSATCNTGIHCSWVGDNKTSMLIR